MNSNLTFLNLINLDNNDTENENNEGEDNLCEGEMNEDEHVGFYAINNY